MPEAQAALGFTRTPSRTIRGVTRAARGAPSDRAGHGPASGDGRHHPLPRGRAIVIGDPNELSFLFSAGSASTSRSRLSSFTRWRRWTARSSSIPRLSKLAYANVQLMPDPTIPSVRPGRVIARPSASPKQRSLVISISRAALDDLGLRWADSLPARSGARGAGEDEPGARDTRRRTGNASSRCSTRLTALEFQNAVVLDDVLVVLQRAEMTTRMAAEIERDCIELGAEARLIQMQLHDCRRGSRGARDGRPRLPRRWTRPARRACARGAACAAVP